jgi:hypothetical protein
MRNRFSGLQLGYESINYFIVYRKIPYLRIFFCWKAVPGGTKCSSNIFRPKNAVFMDREKFKNIFHEIFRKLSIEKLFRN